MGELFFANLVGSIRRTATKLYSEKDDSGRTTDLSNFSTAVSQQFHDVAEGSRVGILAQRYQGLFNKSGKSGDDGGGDAYVRGRWGRRQTWVI